MFSQEPAPTGQGLTLSVVPETVEVGRIVNIKAGASNVSEQPGVFKAIVWRKAGWWILKYVRGWEIAKIYPDYRLGALESTIQNYQYKPEKKGEHKARLNLRDKKGKVLAQREVFFLVK